MSDLPPHASNAVRALILLHEKELRAFLEAWRAGHAREVRLPDTTDPNYASREALLFHVLRAARGYLVWICEKLDLPAPALRAPAPPERVVEDCDAFAAELLAAWRSGLVAVRDDQLEPQTFEASWGTHYCIDAMLEHAVMHPLRHRRQLEELG